MTQPCFPRIHSRKYQNATFGVGVSRRSALPCSAVLGGSADSPRWRGAAVLRPCGGGHSHQCGGEPAVQRSSLRCAMQKCGVGHAVWNKERPLACRLALACACAGARTPSEQRAAGSRGRRRRRRGREGAAGAAGRENDGAPGGPPCRRQRRRRRAPSRAAAPSARGGRTARAAGGRSVHLKPEDNKFIPTVH